jgi:hypothetical protein
MVHNGSHMDLETVVVFFYIVLVDATVASNQKRVAPTWLSETNVFFWHGLRSSKSGFDLNIIGPYMVLENRSCFLHGLH